MENAIARLEAKTPEFNFLKIKNSDEFIYY
jgi:hypothetical protein